MIFTNKFTVIGGYQVAYKFEGVEGYFYRCVSTTGLIFWIRPLNLLDGTPEPKDWNV